MDTILIQYNTVVPFPRDHLPPSKPSLHSFIVRFLSLRQRQGTSGRVHRIVYYSQSLSVSLNSFIVMKYRKLNLATLPDDLFTKQTDVKRWLELTTTSDGGFPPNSLNQVFPIERDVEIERLFGISFYMLGNVFPFVFPLLLVYSSMSHIGSVLLKILLAYFAILFIIAKYNFAKFTTKYNRPRDLSATDTKDNQYLFTERNNQKYTSMQFVWPETIQRPALLDKAVIFCVIPHGVAPLGITAYPVWSKLFNDKLCHWTCAPIVLKIPILKRYMRRIGYIPAKTNNIADTLTKKEENVGIILDGIAGMFQSHDEIGHVKNRKGIIKIALRSGVPIVPVYCFGHTALVSTVNEELFKFKHLC